MNCVQEFKQTLSDSEIITLNTIHCNELVCSELIKDISLVESLKQKGFVEEIYQETAGLKRYRLTEAGNTFHQEHNHNLFV